MKCALITMLLLTGCASLDKERQEENLRIDAFFVAQDFVRKELKRSNLIFAKYSDDAIYRSGDGCINVHSYASNIEYFCKLRHKGGKVWIRERLVLIGEGL